MSPRSIARIVPALTTSEGAGVTVHRTIGTPALRQLDPFLLLDHFGSDDPDQYIAGFPDHPHRGFVTLTYMLDGSLEHRDSMGNRGEIGAHGVQWMRAGSGVVHSEMPRQVSGLMRGFQLWINLPGAAKMSDPAYQEFAAEAIPGFAREGAEVRVLCGEAGETRGPIQDPHTDLCYLHVGLAPGALFHQPLGAAMTAFIYPFAGELAVAGQPLAAHHLAVLGEGGELACRAGPGGAQLILVAGRPLGEPVVQYGPFVMNTREEIEQALADYRDGHLVRARARVQGS